MIRCVHAVCRFMPIARCVMFGITLVHPLLHGSPLDGGALDAVMLQLQLVVAGTD